MSINKEITSILISSKPELKKYVNDKGQLIVKLNKSIYGLRQAPVNFYKSITLCKYHEN